MKIAISGSASDALKALEEQAKQKLTQSIHKAGEIIASEVRGNCPDIEVNGEPLKEQIVLHKKDGSAAVQVKTEDAARIEFGTGRRAPNPFLTPALKNNRDKIIEAVKDEMR